VMSQHMYFFLAAPSTIDHFDNMKPLLIHITNSRLMKGETTAGWSLTVVKSWQRPEQAAFPVQGYLAHKKLTPP